MMRFPLALLIITITFTSIATVLTKKDFSRDCLTCKTAVASAKLSSSAVHRFFSLFRGTFCKTATGKIPFSYEMCLQLSKDYEPILYKVFEKVAKKNSGYICTRVLKKCSNPGTTKLFDSKAWIKEVESLPKPVRIPNHKTEKPDYKILAISDIHVDLDYKVGSIANCDHEKSILCCHKNSYPKEGKTIIKAGKFGYKGCDLPKETYIQFLDNLVKKKNKS